MRSGPAGVGAEGVGASGVPAAHGDAGRLGDQLGQVLVNVHQDLVHGAVAHDFVDHLVQLEGEGGGDVVLLPVATCCSRTGVAWLKWSVKLALRSRTLAPSILSAY